MRFFIVAMDQNISKYTIVNISMNGFNFWFIKHMNVLGALYGPNGIPTTCINLLLF